MKSLSGRLLLLACALMLSACSTSSPQMAAPSSSSVATVSATPLSRVPFAERVRASINIEYPDELVSVGGYVWVKTDDGHVLQVDPAKDSVVGDIKVDTTTDPSHYCQGLGTDGENVWACSAGGDENSRTIDVVRIDPRAKRVVHSVEVGKVFEQFGMPFLLDRIWVLTGKGDRLVGIDTATNQPGPGIDLGARCSQVASTGTSLLVACGLDNLVLRIDPEEAQVTQRLTISSPLTIAATANGVWLSQGDAVVRLDAESLSPVATFTGLPGEKDIYATGDAVWVRSEASFVYRIDPASNTLVEQILSDRALSMGGILVTSDSIWTTASDDGVLMRLKRS